MNQKTTFKKTLKLLLSRLKEPLNKVMNRVKGQYFFPVSIMSSYCCIIIQNLPLYKKNGTKGPWSVKVCEKIVYEKHSRLINSLLV